MKRFLTLLITFVLASAFAWAAPQSVRLTLVKATHPPVHRHRAHRAGRAGRHHRGRRSRHAV